jgi:hypothetical protein
MMIYKHAEVTGCAYVPYMKEAGSAVGLHTISKGVFAV